MEKEEIVYINEISPEEKRLLDAGRKVRDLGYDPVRLLNLFLDAQGTVKKAATVGKNAETFFRKQMDAFKKGYDEKK